MNGGQRNGTNAQIWGKYNDSNYDGNCTARHFRFGTWKISDRWIFVDTSVLPFCWVSICEFEVQMHTTNFSLKFAF